MYVDTNKKWIYSGHVYMYVSKGFTCAMIVLILQIKENWDIEMWVAEPELKPRQSDSGAWSFHLYNMLPLLVAHNFAELLLIVSMKSQDTVFPVHLWKL